MKLIIGSVALRHWFEDARDPKDIDILTPCEVTASIAGIVETQWHDEGEFLIGKSKDPIFADPDLLYSIKVSHAHWDVKWQKTMFDIEFLRRKGAKLDLEVYTRLLPIWEQVHGKKKVNMNQMMTTFFKDTVKREYDHEQLHELVKFTDRPMHERIRPNLSNAWCSEDMWNNLGAKYREFCALEEIMATAIERNRLTLDSTRVDVIRAMHRAHFQLCTSMTKGWFARFLIENKFELLIGRKEEWTEQITSSLKNLSSLQRQTP
jgi:hypothetical protein